MVFFPGFWLTSIWWLHPNKVLVKRKNFSFFVGRKLPQYCHCCGVIGRDIDGYRRVRGENMTWQKVAVNGGKSQSIGGVNTYSKVGVSTCREVN